MSLYQIDKLDEKNYDAWCIHMRSVLIHSSLWAIVNGKEVKENAEDQKWIEKDEKALATITLCIQATQLNHIKKCKTSAEAWNTLQEVFRPSGPVKKVYLYKQLLNANMTDNEKMSDHINNFSGIVDKLAEIGIELNEELVTIILLSSLPVQYEQFVVAMETRDNLPSLQNLKVKLLEEFERKTQRESENTQLAFTAKTRTQNGERSKKQYFKGTQQQGRKRNTGCFICGKQGHFAANCYSKKKQENKNDQRQSQFAVLAAAESDALKSNIWYVDSGATAHMSGNRACFTTIHKHKERITLAGEHYIYAEGIGDVNILTDKGNVFLRNVLYVPKLIGNFVSVSKAVDKGIYVKFKKEKAEFVDDNNDVILIAKKQNNLFVFENERDNKLFQIKRNDDVKWHNRYGHLNNGSLRELQQKEMVRGLKQVCFKNNFNCVTCMKAKIRVRPFTSNNEIKSKNILDLIHTDVCGPFNTQSLGGSRYFITFIDDYSRRIFVYFLKTKNEAFDKFLLFQRMVERQTERKIKCIRSDNGGEFVNKRFDDHLSKCGIKRQLTVPYTPQQNGVAERANRTLVEMARSMLVHSGMKENLWAEAVLTAVYIRNRAPTKLIKDKTPYEMYTGFKPSVNHLRVFGSTAVALDKTQKKKFQQKGKEFKMVGYSLSSKAYRLFDEETKNVVEKRDVYFDESEEKNVVDVPEERNKIIDISKFLVELGAEADSIADNCCDEQCVNDVQTAEEETSQQQQHNTRSGSEMILRSGKKVSNTVNILQEAANIEVPNSVADVLNSKYKNEWKRAM